VYRNAQTLSETISIMFTSRLRALSASVAWLGQKSSSMQFLQLSHDRKLPQQFEAGTEINFFAAYQAFPNSGILYKLLGSRVYDFLVGCEDMATPLGSKSVAVSNQQLEGDYAIKPENGGPKLDTSNWPLLLRNYDK
jgi:hypothetical protein